MRFLLFILLAIFFATSMPALAEDCCLGEVSEQTQQQEKSKTCDVSCPDCIHHNHIADVFSSNAERSAPVLEKLIGINVQSIFGDLKYPLIDPPSYS